VRIVVASATNATAVLDGSLSEDPDGDPIGYLWKTPSGVTLGSGRVTVAPLPLGINQVILIARDGMSRTTNSIEIEVISTTEAINSLQNDVEQMEFDLGRSTLIAGPLLAARRFVEAGATVESIVQLELFVRRVSDLVDPSAPEIATDWIMRAKTINNTLRRDWCDSDELNKLLELTRRAELPEETQQEMETRILAAGRFGDARPESLEPELMAFMSAAESSMSESDPDLSATLLEAAEAIIDFRTTPSDARLEVDPSGMINFEFRGMEGGTYLIEASRNMQIWQPVGMATYVGDSRFQYTDPDAAKTPGWYYRPALP
jgi:hypothetical protein